LGQLSDLARDAPGKRLSVGETWGTLEIRAQVGEGSFGDVYRAWDTVLERDVALKLHRNPQESTGQHLEEARRLARVRHPNVLAVYGVDAHHDTPGMWTEFVSGETLDDELRASGPFGEDELTHTAVTLARAVHAVHAAGLVHGDIKPANVMRDDTGRLVLMDFGAGRDHHERSGVAVGTPIVTSPEVLAGQAISVASDLYALGVLLFRIAAGRYPITARTHRELRERATSGDMSSVAEYRSDLSLDVTRAIDRLLSPDPARRPKSAAAAAEAFATAVRTAPSLVDAFDTASSPAHNLPRPTGRLVGRRGELQRVRHALDDFRLVTLVGHGGVGKTRLALEVARRTYGRDAIYWVELAGLRGSGEISLALARVLDIRSTDDSAATTSAVATAIGDRPVLLVLDNAEHVRDAVVAAAEALLASCPELRLLVTSRERLELADEKVLRLGSLDVPDTDSVSSEEALHADGVRLFCLRAQRANESFRITDRTAPQIIQICRRLDGVPLALELAASRLQAMGIDDLHARLDRQLRSRAPSGERRAEHQTLDAMMSWSVDSLSPEARTLFERLSVFADGFTLSAAESVCGDEAAGEPSVGGELVVDLLRVLVEKSLASVDDTADGSRYRMLQIAQSFAARGLSHRDAASPTERRFLRWCCAVVSENESGIRGPNPSSYMERLGAERANIVSTEHRIDQTTDRADVLSYLDICRRFAHWWRLLGQPAEGLRYIEHVLQLPRVPGDDAARVDTLNAAGLLAADLVRYERAIEYFETALDVGSEGRHPLGRAQAHLNMGRAFVEMARHDDARVRVMDARAAFEALHDLPGVVATSTMLGVTAERSGHVDVAERWYEDALSRQRALGTDPIGLATTLSNIAGIRFRTGRAADAVSSSEEAVRTLRMAGDQVRLSGALITLASIQGELAGYDRAGTALIEAASIHGEIDHPYGMLYVSGMWGGYFEGVENPEAALVCYAFTKMLDERGTSRLSDADRTGIDRQIDGLREVLDPARWQAAMVRGASMAKREFLSFARQATLDPGQER
jgi:non-specific serine/threonine protein kinase